ncbi:MAG: HIT domain-containing protein [Pirellulales bacterium]|nr:HIT domain-containing protein [Pirellulales bacterium]
MPTEHLWAPWRLGYLLDKPEPPDLSHLHWLDKADQGCFLCRAAVDPDLHDTLTVWRSAELVVVLNRYPYNNGHLLIAPRRHVAGLPDLTPAEQQATLPLLTRLTQVLEQQLRCGGTNIGLNLGAVAGAGVPGHLHWHIVPRWAGDQNFMPVTAGVQVLPQSLDALWELLTQALAE